MTSEKKSPDLSNRLSVKRGGRLISKTLGKSSSPPSISTPPKAAVGASKVKKDELQRRKNSFHDMLRGSPKEKDGGRSAVLNVPAPTAPKSPKTHGSNPGSSRIEEATTPDDDIVENLERALAEARNEIAALRQELERVKQDAQASVEISRYQATEAHHATSEDATMQTEVENEILEQERERQEDLINQNHDLRYRLAELQDQLISQSAPHPPNPIHNEEDWNVLTLRLHETEKESLSRLQQLLSLKSSISSLTRTDSQVSDSELAESFAQLANRIREWVVSNYRRTKMNLDNLPDIPVRMLRSIKVNYKEIEAADKLALYQAIVSRMLMRIFDEPLVVGMTDQGIYAGLRTFSEGTQCVGAEFRDWRRVTLRVIEKSVQGAAILHWKTHELKRLANQLEGIMSSISSTELTSSARLALSGIMNSAADLQRTLCVQKAEYCVVFLDTLDGRQHHFDERTMEPVNDLEYAMDEGSEPYTQRKFAFCVFPRLEKLDNDFGNIVFKARVCCGVG